MLPVVRYIFSCSMFGSPVSIQRYVNTYVRILYRYPYRPCTQHLLHICTLNTYVHVDTPLCTLHVDCIIHTFVIITGSNRLTRGPQLLLRNCLRYSAFITDTYDTGRTRTYAELLQSISSRSP